MAASFRQTAVLMTCLLVGAITARLLTPNAVHVEAYPEFDQRLPSQVAQWTYTPSAMQQVAASTAKDTDLSQPYNEVSMRTYRDPQGHAVMLTLAWGQRQRQEVKVHRPDLCYVAQGYKVISLSNKQTTGFSGVSHPVLVHHMLAQNAQSYEAVAYWMRIGSNFSEGALETRMHIIEEGLKGRIPDGILVRSSIRANTKEEAEAAFPLLDQFLLDLYGSTPSTLRPYLIR